MYLMLIRSHIPSLRLFQVSLLAFSFSPSLPHQEFPHSPVILKCDLSAPPSSWNLHFFPAGVTEGQENNFMQRTNSGNFNSLAKPMAKTNNPMMVEWGEGAPATLAQAKYQLLGKAF